MLREQQRRPGFAFHSFGTRLIKYRLHSFVSAGTVTNALRRLDPGSLCRQSSR
jgi:hypothetical protein